MLQIQQAYYIVLDCWLHLLFMLYINFSAFQSTGAIKLISQVNACTALFGRLIFQSLPIHAACRRQRHCRRLKQLKIMFH